MSKHRTPPFQLPAPAVEGPEPQPAGRVATNAAVGDVVLYDVPGHGLRPAVVTRVHEDGRVNLHILKDLEDHAAGAEAYSPLVGPVEI